MSDPYRLPTNVVPSRYDLELRPDLEGAVFSGTVSITVEIVEHTDEVVLNGLELSVSSARIEMAGRAQEARARIDVDHERIHLTVPETLEPGAATVVIDFDGILNDKLVGFYRSTFTDADGNEASIATTQMEATYARQAFPCWDEPAAKAIFAITLVVPDDLMALSNAAQIDETPLGDGMKRVRFADTMVMSTYLVAFVVGPLEVTETVVVNGVPLRVAYLPGKTDLARFALETGAFCLDHLAGYYDIAYPGDKLDLVAIPDFAFGAMENLGCVTFRETLLLVDPAQATRDELERIVDVIAHEIAHMWFGDLVTMKWWNGIWLNEAFATFVEMKTTDAYRPEWNRWNTFGVSRAAAMDTDALKTTRPIEFEVVSPEEAEAMFDVLTYEKGAATVRMLEQFVGADAFRDGIEHYLRTHQYGNTETTDLWDAVEDKTGQPVREMMDTWIFQGGFPVVDVSADERGVHLTQQRFSYSEADSQQWLIPAIVAVERGGAATVDKVLISDDGAHLEGGDVEFVNANSGASGFYRTRYHGHLATAMRASATTRLDPVERFALVDDTWAFVTGGTARATDFIDLARAFRDERDLPVWRALLSGLSRLVDDAPGSGSAELRTAAADIIAEVKVRLGDDPRTDDVDTSRDLRARLFEFAGTSLDDPATIDRAHAIVTADQPDVDPSLAAAAERVVGTHGDEAAADLLFTRFAEATTPQAQLRAIYAVTRTTDPAVHDRLTEFVLTSGEVRTQNQPFVLAQMLANRTHGAATWRRIRADWEPLTERLASSTMPRLVEGIRAVVEPDLANDIRAFLAEHPLSSPRRIEQHVERMGVSVDLATRNRRDLADFTA